MSLQTTYTEEVKPALMKELKIKNVMAVPRMSKLVINIGMGEALKDRGQMDKAIADLVAITGQKPLVTKARISVATFKLREGNDIGLKVTLRGARMYDFLEKLFKVVLPRLRDFQGVKLTSFDGRGNYTLGMTEQIVFPEIDYGKIDRIRGLEITMVTTAKTDEKSKLLLTKLGCPFAKN